MRQADLIPAGKLAQCYGVKMMVSGPPGSGKTPVADTAPRPVLLAIEPGLRSMVKSTVPTWTAFTPERVDEFFTWFYGSNEAKNFDTICIDSASQMAEDILAQELKRKTDGRKLYGNMSDRVMQHMNALYHMKEKHAYIICKEETANENGVTKYRPKFPGQDLHTKIPHLYDLVTRLAVHDIPGHGQHKAFKCTEGFDTMTRDRSGRLAEFEAPNLTAIFNKIMAN